MAHKIEAVIFDWAGTTVDFGSFAPVQAFIEAFAKFGVQPTVAEVREPMGMLKWNHIETMMKMPRIQTEWEKIHGRAFTEADVDAVYAASEAAIMKILHQFATPKPFVLETVKVLRARGVKIGSTTGYTDEMMHIVVPKAKELGYAPDFWCSPNLVANLGRPHPYMIFANLKELGVSAVQAAVKVGDTVADIQEGKRAGLFSIGVIEGSSIMALSQAEYDALDEQEKQAVRQRVAAVYQNCGADAVINNLSELIDVLDNIENK